MTDNVIGSYRLLGKIGEGGMGTVYLAEHVLIGRRAAIKLLLPAYVARPDIVHRFFNEARATSAIDHPAMVTIFDFGRLADGSAYIVMEHLQGESLNRRLHRAGPMSHETAVPLARQIASGVAAAHAKGIIHRDLKPDNVFLVPDREVVGGIRVKILDFGIAKLMLESSVAQLQQKTATGAFMGTPIYMAPEQCRGAGEVDARADVYSLGCILYEMLSGGPPFVAEGIGDIILAHMIAPPPPLGPAVPPPLQTLVMRTLEKSPLARPTMAELEEDLDALGTPRPRLSNEQAAIGVPPAQALPLSTTLSQSTGQSLAPETRSSSWRILRTIGLVTLGCAALAGALFAGTRLGGSRVELPPASADAAAAPPSPPPRPPQPAQVKLTILSQPEGAQVVDAATGKVIGTTPLREHRVPRGGGKVVFLLRLAGHEEQRVELTADADAEKQVTLPPVPRTVEVSIVSKPPGALVLLDGKRVGRTAFRASVDEASLPRTYLVRCAGHDDQRVTVTAAGRKQSVQLVRQAGSPIESGCE